MMWLLKSEPDVYSIDRLQSEKKTNWDHIRNFQARNYLKEMRKGDLALIYHSQTDKAVVGIAEIVKEHYPDPDPEHPGAWVQVDLRFKAKFKAPVTLERIKTTKDLQKLPLIKQSRLSVMPVSEREFKLLVKLGGTE